MPKLEFFRIDLQFIVRREEDGGAFARFSSLPGSYDDHRLSAEEIQDLIEARRMAESFATVFAGALQRWNTLRTLNQTVERAEAYRVDQLPRIVLSIDDPALAALPWEHILAAQALALGPSEFAIVRTSSVRPRFAQVPFTFPMRILQFGPGMPDVRGIIHDALPSGLSASEAAQAIEVYAFPTPEVKGWEPPHGEPTAEIVHFSDQSWMAEPEQLLSTSSPEEPGTLGWLARITDLWQTRLVVIDCGGTSRAEAARRLAQRLVNRGGPAVFIGYFDSESLMRDFYRQFYYQLVHDFPLDASFMKSFALTPDPPLLNIRLPSLFVGAGREDGLRVSNIGINLLRLEKDLEIAAVSGSEESESVIEVRDLVSRTHETRVIAEQGKPITYDWAESVVTNCVSALTRFLPALYTTLGDLGISTPIDLNYLASLINSADVGSEIRLTGSRRELRDHLTSERRVGEIIDTIFERGRLVPAHEVSESTQPGILLEGLKDQLRGLRDEWDNIRFEDHESEGLIPLSRRITALRNQVGVRGPTTARAIAPTVTAPRFVNSSLWRMAQDEAFTQLDRESTRLRVGETCHLGIQIGPEDVRYRAVGATAIIEELFKWTSEMKGVLLEVGVSGIDFDVQGEPVQELWLPRGAPSDFIYFPITPRVAGAPRLRFCIYYQQNLIQSFHLAAFTLEPGKADEPPERRRHLLAAALDLGEESTDDVGYLSRLEYSLVSTADGIETRPARDLSIAANEINGVTVITLKGKDEFDVILPGDLHKYVSDVRESLKRASALPEPEDTDPNKWQYAYGPYPAADSLEKSLKIMAKAGWILYNQMFQRDVSESLKEVLCKEPNGALPLQKPKIISIAHMVRDKVIPWAALYDRAYLPERTEVVVGGEIKPTVNTVCLAALPNADGSLPVSECGKYKDCPLHEDQKRKYESEGKAIVPETVVCPLRFWGFRYIIEIPPQQVGAKEAGRPQRDCILSAGAGPQIAAAYNASLLLWGDHWREVEGMTTWKSKTSAKRQALILQDLKNEELDIIYFYCHARGGVDDAAGKPEHLAFQDGPQAKIEKLTPGGFFDIPKWKHHPLVILNGCGTVGFSPDALSPFLKTLVDDLEAAGILGTEVTVWEELATQATKSFLGKFLDKTTAGQALLTMRRSLLANRNPLGLVYTLYAPAHLTLKKQS